MSEYDDEQEERMRYGADPDSCPACKESISGMCRFHRELEKWKENQVEPR